MYRLILSIWMALLPAGLVFAQDQPDFRTIDSETYRLFLEQKWDSVIRMGHMALKQDIDYYYLRLRLGIASYHRKNYRRASNHFSRALRFNPGDPLALEYLYFSRLFSGQNDQAGLVRKQFMGDLALRLPPEKAKFVERTGGEYLYCEAMTDDLLSDPDALFSGLPPGQQYVTRHFYNLSFSLSHRIMPGLSITHAYNYLSKYNYLFYFDGLNQLHLADQRVYQHQYYISPVITTRTGFSFRPMFHLLSVHFQVPLFSDQGFQGGNNQPALLYRDSIDVVTGMGFSKGIGPFDLSFGLYYATINNASQVQQRLGFTWYPMGNLNLYAGCFLNSQFETTASANTIRHIPEMHAGFAIAEKVWFDLNGAIGPMEHYLEHNGSVIYNSFADLILYKLTCTVSVPVTEKGSLVYLGGRWSANRSEYYSFYIAQSEITNHIDYNAFSIYGGLSWKF